MKKEKISQNRRDYAMRTALATVRLEGLEPDQDAKNLAAKVAKGEMVHGFAPLRCFRHERFLSLSYQVENSVWVGDARNGFKWVYYWFMLRTDTLQITPEILSLIARIDEFKGAWRALGTLAPERL